MSLEDPVIARARLAAIVENSDDAIVSKTLDGVITSWNPAAARLFGYTAEEAVGQHITLIIPVDRHAEEQEVLARLRRGERVDHFDTQRRHKDGHLIDVSLTISPVRGPDGTIVGASKIARDVTERLRLERERGQLLRDAQAAGRAKDEFLAMLGHELRNPLAAVASAVNVIALATRLEDVVRPREVLNRQVTHLRRLIDDLLDVVRARAGKVALDATLVNLREAAEHAVTVLRAGSVPIRHRIDLDVEDVGVMADPVRLEQVILNLLTNAVKYTPAGRRIGVVTRAEDSEAVLRVIDEGVGLTEEALATAFDLFVQVGTPVDRGQGGLGVGLTLVRALVELHGGRVEAASAGPGLGSTFTIRLPQAALPVAPVAEAAPPPALHCRVLIVEDNEDSAEMLRLYLERLGHEVFVASDGAEGVEMAWRVRPEVALIDLGLPTLDGLEVARHIRRQAHQPHQLVALTGYGRPEDRERCLAAGFDTHLVKPVDPHRLQALFER